MKPIKFDITEEINQLIKKADFDNCGEFNQGYTLFRLVLQEQVIPVGYEHLTLEIDLIIEFSECKFDNSLSGFDYNCSCSLGDIEGNEIEIDYNESVIEKYINQSF